ncbi:ribonuclease H-like domain-containing protein [Tanacetum coccineum]
MAVEDTPPPPPPSTTDKIIPFSIPNKVPIKLDLEKHNYNSWSSFSLIHLGSLGLKSHVETDTASTNPEWCQLDDLIKMWILGSLCDSLQEQVVTTPGNAKALWDRLKELFHDNKDARAINLDNELRSIKIGKMTVNEYCTKIRSMADRLINLGCVVSDKNLVIYTINGLDSRFATLVEIIRNRETFPSFENIRTMLLLKESSFNNDSGSSTDFSSSSSSPTVLLASNQSNNKVQQPAQPILFAAHQPHGYGTAQQQQQPVQQQHNLHSLPSNSQGILGAAPALHPSQATSLPSSFSTMTLHDPTWNMDTGATSHLNSNAHNLSTLFNSRLYPSIHVGDGNSIPITNTGHIIIPSLHRPLHLHNVLITPNIIKNLIYVRQFTRDNNCTIEFDAFGFLVKDLLTRHILLRCDSSGDLYLVTKPSTVPAAFVSTSSSTWHQRLGHPGDDVLRSLSSRHLISCNKERSPHVCHACQLGKHVKLPFHSSISSVKQCFDIIHSDLWTSPIGSQVAYLLIYVDDIILTASSPVLLWQIIDSLHKEFDMTDLGELNYFLGISAVRHSTGLFLSQNKYALQLLERLLIWLICNTTQTPDDTDSKWVPDGVPVQDPTLYRTVSMGLHIYLYYAPRFGPMLFKSRFVSICMIQEPHLPLSNNTAVVYWVAKKQREPSLFDIVLKAALISTYVMVLDVDESGDLLGDHNLLSGHVPEILHVPSRYQYAISSPRSPSAINFEDFAPA